MEKIQQTLRDLFPGEPTRLELQGVVEVRSVTQAPGQPPLDAELPFGTFTQDVMMELSTGDLVTIRIEDERQLTPEGRCWLENHGIDTAVIAPVMASGWLLGFVIVKEIVEQHGGTIAVASTPGEGTTFVVWLSLMPSPQTVPAGTPDTSGQRT